MSSGELVNDVAAEAQDTVQQLRRLGRNHGGYHGETIRVVELLRDCREAAAARGWRIEDLPATRGLDLLALHRPARDPQGKYHSVYISSGIHGDEPAGPLAACRLIIEDRWPDNLDLWLCPCLNPTGFDINRRENAHGTDLNRQYLQPEAHEIIAHVAWLERQPAFDLCLCLHEDWEAHGFYLYELNPNGIPSAAELIISRVARVCPIDNSELIDGRPAKGGIIRPEYDPSLRKQWPEAFFLLMHKTRLSYTLEAPSDFPLQARVKGLVTAVRTAVKWAGTNSLQVSP